MIFQLLLYLACGAVGLQLQRTAHGDELRRRLWAANYALVIPLAATYAFLSLQLNHALLALVICAVCAWWITVFAAGGVAYALCQDRRLRGAAWLVGAFPNTGFIGFPLANLAFGRDGLRLAIVYDQISLVIPAVVVATVIARRHAAPSTGTGVRERPASLLRETLVSPPVWTVAALVIVRVTVVREPIDVEWLGTIVGHIVGPIGFLLLGLSIPTGGFAHDRREFTVTGAAVLVRVAVAPLALWSVAHLSGTPLPTSMYLIAAMPTAFHALVISRIHGLEVAVVRLGVMVSSIGVIGSTLIWVAVR